MDIVMEETLKALAAPFAPDEVEWRVGSTNKDKTKGMALAYITARAVMDRLDTVVGGNAWQRRYTHAEVKTICEIGIKLDGEWIWKADGAGDSPIEAEKGAISDAFKRAAVNWGIGRYLYELDSPWVELDEYKRIKTSEKQRLAKLLMGNQPDPHLLKALNKVKEVVGILRGMDFDLQAKWLADNPQEVTALNWVKRNYPHLMKEIEDIGVTL